MNINIELSKKQEEVVFAENEPIYVKASAGSGKTRVLTERVRYMLSQTNKKVLALTFTNKAGEEIKERLSNVKDIEKRSFIGTFHGFCQNLIENHGTLIGYTQLPNIFEDDSDRLELIEQAIQEVPTFASSYMRKNQKEKREFRYRVLNFIAQVKRDLISEDDSFDEDEDVILLYKAYQQILQSHNAIDFDDLLLLAYNLLISFPKISQMYRRSFFSICIDEAQDLNHAQYQIIIALTSNDFKNIMMVGDPNQSIYHFNGSSPDYMNKDFVNDFSPKIVELIENYRSSISVLEAAKKIIPEAEYIRGTIKEGLFKIYGAANEKKESEWVIDTIKDLIKDRHHEDIENEITYEKIAILARNKYVFSDLEIELKNNELPYYFKMTPGAVKFESTLMTIFDLALRVMLNEHDKLHKTALFKKLKISNQNKSVNNLLELKKLLTVENEKHIIDTVLSLKEDGSNFKHLFDKLKEALQIIDENERQMTLNDIEALLKHWFNYAKKTDRKSLLQFKNAMALGQTHPLSQHSGITLSTVHTMKGQEFDIVFIIGMDDETFPDYRAIQKGGIDLTQEKNNCYVAFTRSKRLLFVTWPETRIMPWGDMRHRSISRFLTVFLNK